MKILDITGSLTWISSIFITLCDILKGWFSFHALTIKEVLEILILVFSLVYLIYRIIYEKKRIRKEELEISGIEEKQKSNHIK